MGKKSDLIRAFGKGFECFKALVEAVQDEGGSDVDLNRLLDKDHARTVARVLLGSSRSDFVADQHLWVMEDGSPLQSLQVLNQKFKWVSYPFDGREWTYHKTCVDLVPGSRDFLVKNFNKELHSDEVIAWGDENGYRPATHLEAIAFARAYPSLQTKFWIVALGSSTLGDDRYRYVAVLRGDSDGRDLGVNWLDFRWNASYRFLFVRK